MGLAYLGQKLGTNGPLGEDLTQPFSTLDQRDNLRGRRRGEPPTRDALLEELVHGHAQHLTLLFVDREHELRAVVLVQDTNIRTRPCRWPEQTPGSMGRKNGVWQPSAATGTAP